MFPVETVNYIYAGLLATGGAIGYLKAGSIPSLTAGVGTGLLVFGFTYFNWPYRSLAVSVISAALCVMMGRRFQRSGKIMPAGITAGASLVTLVMQLLHINSTRQLH